MSPALASHLGIPSPGYQYGTGPIPRQSVESVKGSEGPPRKTTAPNVPLDAQMLDEMLTKAVKRGVEESRRKGAPSQILSERNIATSVASNHPPGAWPLSPFGPLSPPSLKQETVVKSPPTDTAHHSHVSAPQGTTWGGYAAPTAVGSHISWAQPARTTALTEISGSNAWSSPQASAWDSWDTTAETWETKDNGWDQPNRRRGRTEVSSAWDAPEVRSTLDNEGWAFLSAPSDTDSSWSEGQSTVRPQSSITAIISTAPAPAPTIKSHQTRSQKESTRVSRSRSTAPPPTWGCAVPPEARGHGSSTSVIAMPPAFSVAPQEFQRVTGKGEGNNRAWSPPSSWGTAKDDEAVVGWGNDDATYQTDFWNNDPSAWRDIGIGEKTKQSQSSRGESGDWGGADHAQDTAWGPKEDGTSENRRRGTNNETKEVEDSGNSWGTTEDSWGKKDGRADGNGWGSANNGWHNSNDKKDDKNAWANDNGWANLNPTTKSESNPWDAPAKSTKPSKSRLSKYRQLRSALPSNAPKPHWKFPPPPSEKKLYPIPEHLDAVPAEPLYKISKEEAQKKGVQHQVRAGKGMRYGHTVGRPEYVDSLDKPVSTQPILPYSRALV